jgi:hypothetical protein
LRRAVERAEAEDGSALPVVRDAVTDPLAVALLAGDLPRLAEQGLIAALAASLPGMRETVTRQLEALRAELLGADPTPVERLLVDRVVMCWLQVQEADLRDGLCAGRFESGQSKYLVGRMNGAHRRYLAALKALELVRKLAVSVLRKDVTSRRSTVSVPTAAAVVRRRGPAGRSRVRALVAPSPERDPVATRASPPRAPRRATRTRR